MITPGAIPDIPGDMDALIAQAAKLKSAAAGFADTGRSVDAGWQGLAGSYHAPEAGTLLAATAPVASTSARLESAMCSAAFALTTFANTVKPLQAQLRDLKSQATALVADINHYIEHGPALSVDNAAVAWKTGYTGNPGGNNDWKLDDGLVDRNNHLMGAVDAVLAKWMEAQRTCANAIDGLYGGAIYSPADAPVAGTSPFGFSAGALDAGAAGDGLPWGSTDKESLDGNDFFVHMGQGAWDAAVGLVGGVASLAHLRGGDDFDAAWSGMGDLVFVHGGSAFGSAWTSLGAGMVSWGQWDDDPGKALGASIVNIGSLFIGTKGAGAVKGGVRAGAEAADVALTGGRLAALMQAGKVALSTRLATVAELRALTAARFGDYAANLAGPRVALAGVGHDVTSRDLFTMHSESKAGGANTAPMAAAGHPASHGVGHSTNPVGSPHNPQVDASPHLDYPKGSPWASSQARENWVRQLLADPSLTKPATGNAAPDVFQRTHLGPTEVKLTSHGEAIWADGLQLDPDKVVAADAKYVLDPGHPKAMYEGGRPEFVYRQFDDEMRRYKLVLEDSSNPVARLRIVTNSEAAARFLAERARGILGPDADLVVVVLKGLD